MPNTAPIKVTASNILVVDDQQVARDVVRDVLEMAGRAVVEAETCERALALLNEQPVGVVVADIFMDGARPDGLDLIARIRAIRPEIRIVAVSGGGGSADGTAVLSAASAAGAHTCLAKPFSAKDLIRAVAVQ